MLLRFLKRSHTEILFSSFTDLMLTCSKTGEVQCLGGSLILLFKGHRAEDAHGYVQLKSNTAVRVQKRHDQSYLRMGQMLPGWPSIFICLPARLMFTPAQGFWFVPPSLYKGYGSFFHATQVAALWRELSVDNEVGRFPCCRNDSLHSWVVSLHISIIDS